jgi:hypothetical protein
MVIKAGYDSYKTLEIFEHLRNGITIEGEEL